ncbi:urea carboxylase [Nocardioides aromaticivorans]|uniref:Urea carboxylase n=1 Tax=Nocardioides aromaticivorans TaxID=200618 RepID=A0ABX7PRU7_9ACTN|nr:urea amidolyase associated protein UAAP2 [Nocardioides aromaticivorans]QSR28498.1 urea carboxylase [Nocardioides aromaticivorans]
MTATIDDTIRIDTVVGAGDGALLELPAGATLRIVDLHGNQAVDTLLYDAHDVDNRYSAFDTVREQGAVYLTTGSRLLSTRLDELAVISDDTCGRHDTIGGACAQESNVIRYGEHTRHQHACRQTFLRYGAPAGIGQRQLGHNINFFMNVPVQPDGALKFDDGLSGPGKYVELRASRDLLVLISNCPQLNNPCNGWDPTPVRLIGRWA